MSAAPTSPTAATIPPTQRVDESARDYDLSAIGTEDWPKRKFPVKARDTSTQVVVKRSALTDIHAHGKETKDIEVCGVLVGNVFKDLYGEPFIYIEANIRGSHADSKSAQVTFTAETWTHIQDTLDKVYPNSRILGWYHTHPGYGIFLSEMDVFIHQNFFSLPWHTALVYDPVAHEEGLFVWRAGQLAAEPFLIEDDLQDQVEDPPATMNTTARVSSGPGAAPGTVIELTSRLQALEHRQRYLVAGLVLLTLIAVAWPVLVGAFFPNLMPIFRTGGGNSEPNAAPAVQDLRHDRPLPGATPTPASADDKSSKGTEVTGVIR